jgi:hypothetical protein
MMQVSITKRNRWVLATALVLALTGAGLYQAAAQEGDPSPATETLSPEPAPRVGTWVDFSFGTGIDKETRVVIGEATSFPADGQQVYCLTRVHGMSPPTSVTHAWYHEGRTMARVDLAIGSENWRTWSFKTYQPAWTGTWEVKVLDTDGMVLGAAEFEVK